MSKNWKRVLGLSLAFGATMAVHAAGPFSQGAKNAAQEATSITTIVGACLGGVILLIGGGIAAWKASHGEPFTKQLIFAIVGVAIAAVSIAA